MTSRKSVLSNQCSVIAKSTHLGRARLSGSFALPKGRGLRRAVDSSGLADMRLSGSFALPKGVRLKAGRTQWRTGFQVDPEQRRGVAGVGSGSP